MGASERGLLVNSTLPTSSSSSSNSIKGGVKGIKKPCFGCDCGDTECDCCEDETIRRSAFLSLYEEEDIGRLMKDYFSYEYNPGGSILWKQDRQSNGCRSGFFQSVFGTRNVQSSLASADTARTQLLSFQGQLYNLKADLDSLKEDKLTLIKTLVSSNVVPFKGTVQHAISSPNALIDRMILQQYTVAIWAGFDQFKEIAEFYKSVHDPYIINAINLVNKTTLQTTLLPVKSLINAETERFKNRIEKTYKEIMELEKAAIPATEDEKNLIRSAVRNVESVIKEQLDAKSRPIQYLLQPRENRDEESDKLSNALNPQTLQQQADAMVDEVFFEQNGDEYLGLDD
ncbi:hypothetical protein TCE0_044f16502 [Talaromyces pinophilus]|uniref:Uncharacterized protein n=1 Tax=Talaromyces pinophilus TaxID=128442 RepID=A0A478EAV9_TALPI|nr:hypothetical protein TCE0_044f16502 [Talaromyces pinophilus]